MTFTPSPEMVELLIDRLADGIPDVEWAVEDADQVVHVVLQAFADLVADPKNDEDAKAWAEATMERHDEDERFVDSLLDGPLYRVKGEPSD